MIFDTIISNIVEVNMSPEYISYESLVAARATADWAFWTMIGAWLSALATISAAVIGYFALSGWQKQEEMKELRDFRVAVYRYNQSLIFAPKFTNIGMNEQDKVAVKNAYDELEKIYISTLTMHRVKTRSNASRVFRDIGKIQSNYMNSKIDNKEAHQAVMHITQTEPLLGMLK